MSTLEPSQHEYRLLALFPNEAAACAGRDAVLADGIPPDRVAIVAGAGTLPPGAVPAADAISFRHAIGHGHAVLIVRPDTAAARERAAAAMERCAPMDVDAHGRRWRPPTAVSFVNHASVSRADMAGRAIGGQDETILDMTGREMTVRRMSDAEMAEAAFAPLAGAAAATWREPGPENAKVRCYVSDRAGLVQG